MKPTLSRVILLLLSMCLYIVQTSAYVPELQKLDGTDAAASRSKRGKEKESDDDTKSRKGRNAPKPAKGRVKVAKSSSNKATNTNDDDEEDYEVEEAKPAKRGRKQSARVANTSSKNAGSIHGGEATDEEDASPAKRGKKQIEKTTKRSLKEGNHEDEADDKVGAKPRKAPTEVKSLPKKVDDAGPTRRPQRKARQA